MNDKSYVSMETHVCAVCGVEYQTNSLLLDKRLKPSMGSTTCTGWGLCNEHQQKFDEGYVALVEIDETKGERTLAGAFRTGNVAHVRRMAWERIFNTQIDDECPMAFIEIGVLEKLQATQQGAER